MAILRTKRSQAAQGMVEFALVLPILLLVLLGIIAFGHLFFVYSFTVASSREAARWGAAVGVTDAGLPRFRDCASIRAAAQRVGGIIGVTSNVVSIGFDHGPGTPVYATCPLGGEGPDVTLGDRIIVTVNITYQPIVPLVNLPTYPLQGITTRTIIRSLPVGDAPTAESPCYNTVSDVLATTSPLDIGVWETFSYSVRAKTMSDPNPGSSDGYVDIYVDGVKLNITRAMSGTFTYNFNKYGTHEIEAVYNSSNYHFCPSSTAISYTVRIPSEAHILSDDPDPSASDQKFTVQVEVVPQPAGIVLFPTGQVALYDSLDPTVGCLINLDPATGKGSCDFNGYKYVGVRYLIASYKGDANFAPSPDSTPADHTIAGTPTPTLISPATVTPSPTPVPICPILAHTYNFTDQLNGFYITINNPDITQVKLTSITATWPVQPGADALLQQIRYATDTSDAAAACNFTSPAGSCLWGGVKTLAPDLAIVGPSPNPFLATADTSLQPGNQKQLRLIFNRDLPDTDPSKKNQTKYQLILEFDKTVFGIKCKITVPVSERPPVP
jgi:Flp pilus assembly protein TadG